MGVGEGGTTEVELEFKKEICKSFQTTDLNKSPFNVENRMK